MSRCPARPEATLANLAARIDILAALALRVQQHEAVADEARSWFLRRDPARCSACCALRAALELEPAPVETSA